MPVVHDEASEAPAAFRLGEWTIEPELGRISRGDEVVQLRPRAMEVLVTLAVLEGRLASKQHLIDTVWRTEFVSENALTHVIAELRTELGDDAENPSYIETIPRRGYRVIAPVTTLDAEDREYSPVEGEDLIGRAPDADAARTVPATPPRKPRARWLVPAAAAALAVIAIGLWVVLGGNPGPTPGQLSDFVPNRVVVAEFENRIGDPTFDDFGIRVADSITALLRQVGRLTVATNPFRPGSQARTRLGETAGTEPLRRLAEATRSGLVVTGACYSRGDQVEIQARIVNPWRDEVRQAFDAVRVPRSDPSPAVEILSQQVAGTLALHFENMVPLGLSRPVPLAAVQEYAGFLEHYHDWNTAISRLERVLEIGPEFHLARGHLFRRYAFSSMYPNMTRYDRACVHAWRALLERRPLDVLRAFREAVELAPNSYWARNKMGAWAISTNRPREAVEVLSDIPFDWTSGGTAHVQRPFVNLCFAYHMLGDDKAMLRLAAESLEHFPDAMIFYGLQANALGVMGRFDEMNHVLEKSLAIRHHTRTSAGVSFTYTARELRGHGYRAQSLGLGDQAVNWFNERPDEIQRTPWHYAAALNVAERWEEALEATEKYARERPEEVQYLGLPPGTHLLAGVHRGTARAARRGRTPAAAGALGGRLILRRSPPRYQPRTVVGLPAISGVYPAERVTD
jgi:DNA-binding winged helix-turn-helix (wHTH) protein/tetratricopeptide (TPR) repeat protein